MNDTPSQPDLDDLEFETNFPGLKEDDLSGLDEYERSIFKGHTSGEYFIGPHDGQKSIPQMYLMDAEYDPFHVVFSHEEITIIPGDNKYVSLTVDMLLALQLGSLRADIFWEEEFKREEAGLEEDGEK